MDILTANGKTYDLVAKITNPASRTYMLGFPGLDKLGFKEDEYASKKARVVSNVIIAALEAGRSWKDHGENSKGFGRIEAMLEFGIFEMENIETALLAFKNNI